MFHSKSCRFLAPLFAISLTLAADAQTPAVKPDNLYSQTAAPSTAPSFEVSTVRMVQNDDQDLLARGVQPQSWSTYPTNHVYYHRVPLNLLVAIAYGIDLKYVFGQPNWMDSQQYDIDAKVENDRQVTSEQVKPLLQNLLAQRFNFKAHHDSRIVSGYALVVAKDGTKLRSAGTIVRPVGTPNALHISLSPTGLDAWDISMNTLSRVLQQSVGQPVMDKTDLTGSYDINLSFAPPNDASSTLPSIFTALQEQLGLKLNPAKVPVDNLVIDQVDRVPSEN